MEGGGLRIARLRKSRPCSPSLNTLFSVPSCLRVALARLSGALSLAVAVPIVLARVPDVSECAPAVEVQKERLNYSRRSTLLSLGRSDPKQLREGASGEETRRLASPAHPNYFAFPKSYDALYFRRRSQRAG